MDKPLSCACHKTLEMPRRLWLQSAACGCGGVALAHLLSTAARGAQSSLQAAPPQHAPRARRVIFLFMAGGPSQLDLFDPKPFIAAKHGQRISPPIDGRKVAVGIDKYLALAPDHPARPRGESGLMVSDLMPHLARIADDLCLLRAMPPASEAHAPAPLHMPPGVSLA